jgi:hypothetical protein
MDGIGTKADPFVKYPVIVAAKVLPSPDCIVIFIPLALRVDPTKNMLVSGAFIESAADNTLLVSAIPYQFKHVTVVSVTAVTVNVPLLAALNVELFIVITSPLASPFVTNNGAVPVPSYVYTVLLADEYVMSNLEVASPNVFVL